MFFVDRVILVPQGGMLIPDRKQDDRQSGDQHETDKEDELQTKSLRHTFATIE